jgi:PAS domain S-box-containing protein
MRVSHKTKERLREFFGVIVPPDPELQDAVRDSKPGEQDWREILDTLTDMITVHDRDFNIIYANKAAESILGLPLLNISGAKCFEFYHGGGLPPEGCPGRACLRTGEGVVFEAFEPHLNMYIEVRTIPRFDGRGEITGLIHVVRDITARRLIEEELDIHRNHLEWLVGERTAEISRVNERLQREISERQKAEVEREMLIGELREALSNIKTLNGLLPICAWCKKIRDDGGYWQQVEAYVSERSDAEFTHAICPQCMERLRDDFKTPGED